MEISIILPACREAENLKSLLPRIKGSVGTLAVGYEVLVVDARIPMDGTRQICEENGALYVSREGGDLYGDAVRTGIARARGRYAVVMDADGSHDPQAIASFYREMQEADYDIVIGSRYCRGGHTDNPAILRLMSWALNVTYRVMFRLPVRDVSDSFRMYNASRLKGLSLECNNFDIVEEILIKMKYQGPSFKVKEVPISFNKRAAGESKRELGKFICSYLRTMGRLLRIRRETMSQTKNGQI